MFALVKPYNINMGTSPKEDDLEFQIFYDL